MKGKPSKDSQFANAKIGADGEALEQIPDVDTAWNGARDIVAEVIAEKASLRAEVRHTFLEEGELVVEVARGKSKDPELEKYRDHLDKRERAKSAPSHRILAAERGESEGLLKVTLQVPETKVLSAVRKGIVKQGTSSVLANELELAIQEATNRLILPSLESEQRRALKERADKEAIAVFANNLTALLLSSPLGEKPLIAIDPGLRTGCKVVALSAQGEVKGQLTIYPHTGRESEAATRQKCDEAK